MGDFDHEMPKLPRFNKGAIVGPYMGKRPAFFFLALQLRRLEALATAEDRYRLAYLLVGESGGNILRSFVAAGESADRVLEGR